MYLAYYATPYDIDHRAADIEAMAEPRGILVEDVPTALAHFHREVAAVEDATDATWRRGSRDGVHELVVDGGGIIAVAVVREISFTLT